MIFRNTNTFINMINSTLIHLPITYVWNIGSLLSLCLIIQILSNRFLAIHFSSDISTAFSSVSHISRDANYGWLIRSIHANTASLCFIVIWIILDEVYTTLLFY